MRAKTKVFMDQGEGTRVTSSMLATIQAFEFSKIQSIKTCTLLRAAAVASISPDAGLLVAQTAKQSPEPASNPHDNRLRPREAATETQARRSP